MGNEKIWVMYSAHFPVRQHHTKSKKPYFMFFVAFVMIDTSTTTTRMM